MKIIQHKSTTIEQEIAHGGSGSRKLYIDDGHSPSERVQGMTHGWLPAGNIFDWHNHPGVEEIVYVLKGTGLVSDEDGDYMYEMGDVLIFPAGVKHKISNKTTEEHEFIFFRIYE